MSNSAARAALDARFAKLKEEHDVVDVKFYVGNVTESTVEEVCSDADYLLSKYEAGNYRTRDSWGDSKQG